MIRLQIAWAALRGFPIVSNVDVNGGIEIERGVKGVLNGVFITDTALPAIVIHPKRL